MSAAFFAATGLCRVRRTNKHTVNKNLKKDCHYEEPACTKPMLRFGEGRRSDEIISSIVSLNHRLIDTMKQWTNDSIN